MSEENAVAVLGAGSWGTALAYLLDRQGCAVRLWARDEASAQELARSRENVRYLPGVALDSIFVSADLSQVLDDCRRVVVAVPGAAVGGLAEMVRGRLRPDAVLISGTKGLQPATGLRPAQIWEQVAGLPSERYAALSGPNLAQEIVAGVPTSTVVAALDAQVARDAQRLFSSRAFRVYTNDDLIGVELGGALKNIVAIAAGIGDGFGFGDNSKATLLTRAWREMARLAVALGARESTLYGLSGMGDLFATAASPQSRNHRLGVLLARGETLGEAQHEVAQVAEGVHTTRAALRLAAGHNVALPVTEQVAAVLFEGRDPRQAVETLMTREGCSETD
jgi:glycerol-3-phosphate dehydrogenase (NAD(P)+)